MVVMLILMLNGKDRVR